MAELLMLEAGESLQLTCFTPYQGSKCPTGSFVTFQIYLLHGECERLGCYISVGGEY